MEFVLFPPFSTLGKTETLNTTLKTQKTQKLETQKLKNSCRAPREQNIATPGTAN
jgi:hypothetical protein